jgi:quinol-cytochrome oxidoreductase complex cytochrome b subunit
MINSDRNPTAIERFLLHIHPPRIDKRAIKFTRTFGLGGVNVLLFVLLVITGVLLRFTYVPTPEGAYDSILFLQDRILFGKLLRNIHHFSAMLMVITSFLHLLRVFYSQSFYEERAKNWIYGLLLMFFVLFANFTGYLLPWDQLAFWAVTIMTEMLEYIPLIGKPLANLFRGGAVVDGTTLLNFYSLHTGLLPAIFAFLMIMHFWLIRKAKGVKLPDEIEPKSERVDVYPNLVMKEILLALIVLVGIFVLSIFVNAPLLDKASTSISPNPSKAPWYFMGVQELLMHIHPTFAVFVIPVALLGLFFYMPYFKYAKVNQGVWFNSNLGKSITLKSALFALVTTIVLILASEYIFDFLTWFPELPLWINSGILPLSLYLIPTSAYFYYWYKIKKVGGVELMMALITVIIVSYIVMMFMGEWYRGEGMHLIF